MPNRPTDATARFQGPRLLALGLLSALFLLPAGHGASAEEAGLSETELVQALRDGGHVVFIRHASTEKDYADQIDAVMGDCSTQRTLSEAGWQEARDIGDAFARLEIPVGPVVSSQYCRAWQTAELAFGEHVKNGDLNFEPAETYTEAQTAAMRDRVRPHLGTVPAAGENLILIGHDDPFEAATGIYPEPMGVTYVLRPDGSGGFEVLGHIDPTAWPESVD
ncbi:MAG: histidine phosphatase family protein [Rhodospirillales bacterium]